MCVTRIFPLRTLAVAAPRVDPRLLRALAFARHAAQRVAAHATALGELGDIELPDAAPTAEDAQHLEAIAPLYLAHELEQAGLLRTAELIAGLFASGAITQPLGPTAQLLADFWKGRRERLAAPEREQLFAQVFDASGFYPLMQALCSALTQQLDSPPQASDVQGRVALQQAAEALGGWLAPHAVGMALFAAHDIVQAVSQATHFMRDRLLQTAFGVRDLWGLIETVGSAQGTGTSQIRQHVELGREGGQVLAWLAQAIVHGYTFEPESQQGQALMMAAQAWLSARAALQTIAGAAPAVTRSTGPLLQTA